MTDSTGRFTPWRDDALLAEESIYALWSKISWFSVVAPTKLVRACRTGPGHRAAPSEIVYSDPSKWLDYLENGLMLPRIGGEPAQDVMATLARCTHTEIPWDWAAEVLRTCEACIAEGIHLRVHQHLAVSHCPLHGHVLRSACDACGKTRPYTSKRQRAFCCEVCGYCWLTGGEIRFGFSEQFRTKLGTLCKGVHEWLRPLGAGVHRALFDSLRPRDLGRDVSFPDGHSMLLAGIRNSSSQIPPWILDPALSEGEISIASVLPYGMSLRRSITRAQAVDRWVLRERALMQEVTAPSEQKKSGSHSLATRYHQAFKRVTANFLHAIRDSHSECLDTPNLISPSYRCQDGFKQDILSCCPVALGFWLWRKRGGMYFTDLVARADSYLHEAGLTHVSGSLDLLFYSLERSDLHACVLVAQACSSLALETGSATLACARLEQWHNGRRYFFQAKPVWLDFEAGGNGMTFVRVDASRFMAQVTCPGLEPFHESLRHRLRATPLFDYSTMTTIYVNIEEIWPQRAAEKIALLEPLEGDWIFFHSPKRAPDMRRDRFETCRAINNLSDSKHNLYQCVDSAIELRFEAQSSKHAANKKIEEVTPV